MIWLLFVSVFILIVVIFWMSPSAKETKRRGFRSWKFWLTTYNLTRQHQKEVKGESIEGDYFEPGDDIEDDF